MRTCANGVELNGNGKYSVSFISYSGVPGAEYVSSQVESGAVFDTEDEAYAGQQRALTLLENTGKYPNMCEKF